MKCARSFGLHVQILFLHLCRTDSLTMTLFCSCDICLKTDVDRIWTRAKRERKKKEDPKIHGEGQQQRRWQRQATCSQRPNKIDGGQLSVAYALQKSRHAEGRLEVHVYYVTQNYKSLL